MSGLFFAAHAIADSLGMMKQMCPRLAQRIVDNKFTVNRDLKTYSELFEFSAQLLPSLLSSLGPSHHWVDMGGGIGQAAVDYLTKSEVQLQALTRARKAFPAQERRAFVTNVLAKLPENAHAHPRLRVVEGFVEDLPKDAVRPAQVITDVYGPMTYSARVDRVIRRYLDLLTDNGIIFLHTLGSETTIRTSRGEVWLQDWLSNIEGISVTSIGMGSLAIRITDRSRIRVPSLIAESIEAGDLPVRRFRESEL